MHQTALQTSAMSLDEVVADHADAFDAVGLGLQSEALDEAHLDLEAQLDPEFGPIRLIREAGDSE